MTIPFGDKPKHALLGGKMNRKWLRLKTVTTSQLVNHSKIHFFNWTRFKVAKAIAHWPKWLILTKALIHEAGLVAGIPTKQFALHHPPQAQAQVSLSNLLINDLCRRPCNFIWLVDAMDCWAGVGWLQHSPWSEVPAFWNIMDAANYSQDADFLSTVQEKL